MSSVARTLRASLQISCDDTVTRANIPGPLDVMGSITQGVPNSGRGFAVLHHMPHCLEVVDVTSQLH